MVEIVVHGQILLLVKLESLAFLLILAILGEILYIMLHIHILAVLDIIILLDMFIIVPIVTETLFSMERTLSLFLLILVELMLVLMVITGFVRLIHIQMDGL